MAYYWAPMIASPQSARILGYPTHDAPRGTGAIHDRGYGPKLIHVPQMTPHPQWLKLAEHADEPLSATARRWCGYGSRMTFADAVGRWLRPQLTQTVEGRYEIWCGDPTRPLWSRLAPLNPRTQAALPLVVREYWRTPQVQACFLDHIGMLPAVSVAAIGLLLACGMIPPTAAWLLLGLLPATDGFAGTNGQNLESYSANWVAMSGAGTMQINVSAVIPNASGALSGYRWNADTFDSNHYSQGVKVEDGSTGDMGVAVRCQSGAFSLYSYYNNGTKSMNRISAGTNTPLGSGGAVAVNDVLRLEANGSTIRGKLNGALDTAIAGNPFTDANHTGGSAGLAGQLATTTNRLDSWEGGNLAPPAILHDFTGFPKQKLAQAKIAGTL